MDLIESVHILCPCCGETIETTVDTSAGDQEYVEDCPVCCQPMELHIQVPVPGMHAHVSASSQDG